MAEGLGPDPGIAFSEGSVQAGAVWISELIRLVNKKLPAQDDSTATTVAEIKDDFNDLLAKLRAAGKMET